MLIILVIIPVIILVVNTFLNSPWISLEFGLFRYEGVTKCFREVGAFHNGLAGVHSAGSSQPVIAFR